ncbi:hypothetical protein GCM10029963_56730 [Micromonospora andamanensis]
MPRPPRARVPITATLLTLGLAVTGLAGVPAAQAAPSTETVAQSAPVQQAAPEAVDTFSVLVFSKTAGFRHASIPTGIAAIQELGAEHGFTVDTTEDGAAFTDANLAQYRAVIWLSTTGDVLTADQQAAFERYIQAGGGYAGIHAAADTEYSWSWYGELVGAYFNSHPANQTATVKVEDPAHPPPRTCRSAGPGSTSGTTTAPTRVVRCTCWPPSTRPATPPGPGRWGTTTRSPGVRTMTAAEPGTQAVATPTSRTPNRSSAPTCSAVSAPRLGSRVPTAGRR